MLIKNKKNEETENIRKSTTKLWWRAYFYSYHICVDEINKNQGAKYKLHD